MIKKKSTKKNNVFGKMNYKVILPLVAFAALPLLVIGLQQRGQDIRSRAAGATDVQPVGQTGNWNMIFNDEFDGTSLDTSKWMAQRGDADWQYGDPAGPDVEDAYYVTNNVSVSNGNLALNLVKQSSNGYPYTSGWVQTHPAFNYKYGYAEARIKTPTCDGCWPAFWTENSTQWPPEIDIFEFFNEPFPSFNYHFGTSSSHQQSGPQNYGTPGVDYTADFHVYGMYWDANRIQVYLDGQPGPSYTNKAQITALQQFLILNLALEKGFKPNGAQMLVDYVRVWQPGTSSVTPTKTPTPTAIPTATPTPAPVSVLQNGSFETTLSPWGFNKTSPAAGSVSRSTSNKTDGASSAQVVVTNTSSNPWYIQLGQDIPLQAGKTYTITYWAKASVKRQIQMVVQESGGTWAEYTNKTVNLTKSWQKFTSTFTAPKTVTGFFSFNLAKTKSTVWFDGASVVKN